MTDQEVEESPSQTALRPPRACWRRAGGEQGSVRLTVRTPVIQLLTAAAELLQTVEQLLSNMRLSFSSDLSLVCAELRGDLLSRARRLYTKYLRMRT